MFEKMLHFQYNFMRKFNPDLFLRPSAEYVKKNIKGELVIAEIGVAHGLNALAMLQNLNIKHIYLVDPWDKIESIREKDKLYAKKLLKGYEGKTTYINEFSVDAYDKVPDDLDYVYIDADKNRYESAYKDIELYYPKVRNGGILGGHDFDGHYQTQCRAVIDFCNAQDLKLHTWKKDWWFVKKERKNGCSIDRL